MKFGTDYIITWDISEKDCPTISVSKIEAETKNLKLDVLGVSHEQSGVVSLRQLLEEYEDNRREDNAGEVEKLKEKITTAAAEYEALFKRFSHLMKSDLVRQYDAYDRKTHTYKNDILKLDNEYRQKEEAYEILKSCTTCNTCKKSSECEYIMWGDKVVYNCPHYKKK